MVGNVPQQHTVIEVAPARIWLHDLREMLAWYEKNLCEPEFLDPRGHRVQVTPERFPHCIQLLQKNSTFEVNNPQKHVLAIKEGTASNEDFGGYDTERAQTLGWIPYVIQRPSRILELITQPLIGKKKAGDTLYIKRFCNTKSSPRYKRLVCRRVGPQLLLIITCHPDDHDNYSPKLYRQVYPEPNGKGRSMRPFCPLIIPRGCGESR